MSGAVSRVLTTLGSGWGGLWAASLQTQITRGEGSPAELPAPHNLQRWVRRSWFWAAFRAGLIQHLSLGPADPWCSQEWAAGLSGVWAGVRK